MFVLSDLYIYPIKSLGGIRLPAARVEARGLEHDRRWLLVDEAGVFLTQRSSAALALLTVTLADAALVVSHRHRPALAPLVLPLHPHTTGLAQAPVQVRIWEDVCAALPVGPAADAWFGEALGRSVRLVYMPDTTHRPADPAYAPAGSIVSFADAFPLLVVGEAALHDLNARLRAKGEPAVPMDRFRPNLVFRGGLPHAEDGWTDFRLGTLPFRMAKPCARCLVPTIDQHTARAGKEPLRTLNTYRRRGNSVLFGMDALSLAPGTVHVGDVLTVG